MMARLIKRLFAHVYAQAGVAKAISLGLIVCLCGLIGFGVQAPAYAQKANQPEVKKSESKQDAKVDWAKLSADQQLALAPVKTSWTDMSGAQQKRLVSAAKDYAKLQPIQKERFQTRLRDWAALTPEQRKVARAKYETLSKLPPAKQFEIHEKWQDKQAGKAGTTPLAPPATPPTSAPPPNASTSAPGIVKP